MELEIIRTYFTEGTNGTIFINSRLQCYTIELPWLDNRHQVSCIPEGRYGLKKRYSEKFGWHYEVLDVEARQDILIHPANDALHELKGCIAPVSMLTGEGKGNSSRLALEELKKVIDPVLETEALFIILKNNKNEYHTKGASSYTEVL